MNVHDFDFIRVIGRGSYAKVLYVSDINIVLTFETKNFDLMIISLIVLIHM